MNSDATEQGSTMASTKTKLALTIVDVTEAKNGKPLAEYGERVHPFHVKGLGQSQNEGRLMAWASGSRERGTGANDPALRIVVVADGPESEALARRTCEGVCVRLPEGAVAAHGFLQDLAAKAGADCLSHAAEERTLPTKSPAESIPSGGTGWFWSEGLRSIEVPRRCWGINE